jgi:predicted small metal-binding protein
MTRVLHCADLFAGCDAVVRADNDDEVLEQAAVHTREVHDLAELDDATVAAVRGAIREE